MTKLLAQAFEKAAGLPEELQDQLARELLEEIEWESRWDATLAGSQEKLERLAERAAEKALMKGVRNFETDVSPSRRHLEAALGASSLGVEALFTCLVSSGALVRKRGPLMLLAYLISHESHHRGSMMLALKQNGCALSEAMRWGIWGKWFEDREPGHTSRVVGD